MRIVWFRISIKFGTELVQVTLDLQQTFKVKGSKIKVIAWKRPLLAKLLLLCFRKSESLNLMAEAAT